VPFSLLASVMEASPGLLGPLWCAQGAGGGSQAQKSGDDAPGRGPGRRGRGRAGKEGKAGAGCQGRCQAGPGRGRPGGAGGGGGGEGVVKRVEKFGLFVALEDYPVVHRHHAPGWPLHPVPVPCALCLCLCLPPPSRFCSPWRASGLCGRVQIVGVVRPCKWLAVHLSAFAPSFLGPGQVALCHISEVFDNFVHDLAVF